MTRTAGRGLARSLATAIVATAALVALGACGDGAPAAAPAPDGSVPTAAGTVSPAPAPSPAPCVVSGVVEDDAGAPLAGAEVRVFRDRDRDGTAVSHALAARVHDEPVVLATTVADAAGRFAVRTDAGPALVVVSAPGFGRALLRVDAVPAAQDAPPRFRLARARTFEGRVVGADGTGLAGVRVVAFPWSSDAIDEGGAACRSVATTDAAGAFRFEDRNFGSLTIAADLGKGGACVVARSGWDDPGAVLLRADADASLTVRVADAAGGAVAGAAVLVDQATRTAFARTDAEGVARLAGLVSADVARVVVTAEGRAPAAVGASWDEPLGEMRLAAGENAAEVVAQAGATLRGRVVDQATWAGLAGARVVVRDAFTDALGPRTARTGADGEFEVRGLPDGRARVLVEVADRVEADGTRCADDEAVRDPGDGPVVIVSVASRVYERTIATVPAPRVSGRVLLPDGTPAAGAIVEAQESFEALRRRARAFGALRRARWGDDLGVRPPPSRVHVADAAGRFDVPVATVRAEVRVVASAPGCATSASDAVRVAPDAAPATDVVVRLRRPARIEGRVTDGAGAPIAGARLHWSAKTLWMTPGSDARAGGAGGGSAVSGADGRYAIADAAPGPGALRAERRGFLASDREDVVADPSAPCVADVALERSASIEGLVLGPGGAPVAGATVGVRPVVGEIDLRSSSGLYDLSTRRDGVFRAEGLPPGEYLVRAATRDLRERRSSVPRRTAGRSRCDWSRRGRSRAWSAAAPRRRSASASAWRRSPLTAIRSTTVRSSNAMRSTGPIGSPGCGTVRVRSRAGGPSRVRTGGSRSAASPTARTRSRSARTLRRAARTSSRGNCGTSRSEGRPSPSTSSRGCRSRERPRSRPACRPASWTCGCTPHGLRRWRCSRRAAPVPTHGTNSGVACAASVARGRRSAERSR